MNVHSFLYWVKNDLIAGFDGAPEELDVTLFVTFTNSFAAVDRAAAEFVAKACSYTLFFEVS